MSKFNLIILTLCLGLAAMSCTNPAGGGSGAVYLTGEHEVKWVVTGTGDIDCGSTGDDNYLIVQNTIGLTPATANYATNRNYGLNATKTYNITFNGSGATLYGWVQCDLISGTGSLTLSLYIDNALIQSRSLSHTYGNYSDIEVTFTTAKL